MKIPFNRQRLISSGALQLPDRSIVNAELNLDRDVGIQAFSNNLFGLTDYLSINLGVFGGDGRNRTNPGSGLLTIAKLTYYPFGNFLSNRLAGVDDELLAETDFAREKTPKIAIGIASAYNNKTNRERSTFGKVYQFAEFDYRHYSADFIVKWMGFTFLTELLSRQANLPYIEKNINNQLIREYSRSTYGYFIQTSYLFESNWELTARWGEFKPWEGTNPEIKLSREMGGGISYYFSKHNLKWQADYFKLSGDPTLTIGSYEIRTQLQLFY
jgi:phosphate-selective porin OprO and OprP